MKDKNVFVKRNELVSLKGNTLSIQARKMLDYICKIGLDVYKQKMDEEGIFNISIRDLKEVADMNLRSDHSQLLEELKLLSKIEVETWDDRYYSQFPILAGFKIQDKDGIVEIALSPFLLRETFKDKDDEPYYHYCNLMEYKGLRSKYSKIILDLHTRYKPLPIPKMNMKKFKDLLQYPEKYKNNDIKRFVLEQAQRELLEKNNLKIDWEIEKLGRKWGYITILAIPIEDSVTAKIDDKVIEISEKLDETFKKAKKNRFIEPFLTDKNKVKLISKFTNEEQLIKGLNHAHKEIKKEVKTLAYLIKAINSGIEKQEIKIEVVKNDTPSSKPKEEVIEVIGEGKEEQVKVQEVKYTKDLESAKRFLFAKTTNIKIPNKMNIINNFKDLESAIDFGEKHGVDMSYFKAEEVIEEIPKEEAVKVKPKREMTQNQYDCLFEIYLSSIRLTLAKENKEIDVEEERKK
ncbi:replication initiation protein, partial [Cetobacterium sp.]